MHLSVPVYYCDCFDFKHILHKTGPSAICRIYSLELPNILKQQPLTTFLDPAATRSIPSPGHGLHPLQLAEAGGVVSVRWQYMGICCDAWAAEECFSSNTANTGTAWGCHGCDRSKTCWSWITCTHTNCSGMASTLNFLRVTSQLGSKGSTPTTGRIWSYRQAVLTKAKVSWRVACECKQTSCTMESIQPRHKERPRRNSHFQKPKARMETVEKRLNAHAKFNEILVYTV